MCLCTRAEREFDSAEQCFKSISNLGLLQKCWCDLAMVGIKFLGSARKYNPEKKMSFEKEMYVYIGRKIKEQRSGLHLALCPYSKCIPRTEWVGAARRLKV